MIPSSADDRRTEDPLVRSAGREALVVGICWLLAMTFTVGYCYLFGYDRPPGEVKLIWGIPDWVFWGIFAPWLVCYLFSWWFSYRYMGDEELESGQDEEQGDGFSA